MCLLCGDKTRKNVGPILTSLNCHLLCIKFASGILNSSQPPTDLEVSREVRRAQRSTCVFCGEIGAFIGCSIKQCNQTYHLHCGVANGCLNQYHKFSSYCPQHRPKNILPIPAISAPTCSLCSNPIREQDLVLCPGCKTSFHISCCQERADLGQTSCPNCGDTEEYISELSFYGVWFRDKQAEKLFLRLASGPPSYVISNLSTEVRWNREHQGQEPPLRGSDSSRSPDPAPVSNILEFMTDTTPREDETGSSSRTSSRERDSSPLYRRKLSKLPGRSPKKTIVKQITNDLRRNRPRSQNTSASGSDTDQRTSSALISEEEREKTDSSGSHTLQPPRKKVKVTFTDSSDGPLSDIDDILRGNIFDPETHPMKAAIFSQDNVHSDEILSRISQSCEESSSKQKQTKSTKEEALKLKNGKKKVPVKKSGQGRTSFEKKSSKKFANQGRSDVSVNQNSKKRKVTRTVRMLPLTARQIYHGRNWIPMTEVREEESECNFEWIKKFGNMRLEDIADLNSGEKTMMNMWNRHLENYKVTTMKHMDQIVMDFIKNQKEKILRENLYRNLMAHLCDLQLARVLSQQTFLSVVSEIQNSISSEEIPGQQLTRSWSTHFPRTVPSPSISSSPSSFSSSSSPMSTAASPLSRGMKIMNLSLNSNKSQDSAKKTRLSSGSIIPPVSPNSTTSDDEQTTAKKPRLSDSSSYSSRGSMNLQLSESSFSSHSSAIDDD